MLDVNYQLTLFQITQQNDLYITGLLDGPGARRQRTDTHLRSKKGKGSFNWRMKFPVTLPMKSPRFSIQIWDMDFFSPNVIKSRLQNL